MKLAPIIFVLGNPQDGLDLLELTYAHPTRRCIDEKQIHISNGTSTIIRGNDLLRQIDSLAKPALVRVDDAPEDFVI